MAIAGIVAAPVASAEVYVSARLGVESVSHDDATQEGMTFGNLSSRLGWRGETDLGNGMTAFGSLEAAAVDFGLRQLHVGLSGDFGSVKVGESTYAAFYNHVSGPVDVPYWVGGSGLVQSGRTADVINYSGGSGSVSFDVALEADGTDTTDPSGTNSGLSGTQVAVSVDLGDWTVALGMRDAEDSANSPTAGTVTGVTVHGNVGDISVAASFQEDDNNDGIQLHVGFGAFFVNYGSLDNGTTEPTELAVGYSQSLGRNTTFWAEAASIDSDGGDDSTEIVAALRYDFN